MLVSPRTALLVICFVPAQKQVSIPRYICHMTGIRRLENDKMYWNPAHKPQVLSDETGHGLHENRASQVAPTSNT